MEQCIKYICFTHLYINIKEKSYRPSWNLATSHPFIRDINIISVNTSVLQ